MELTILIEAIIIIALIFLFFIVIISALIFFDKLKCKIKRHKEVRNYQCNLIADLTNVIADLQKEISEWKFICTADDDIIEVLEQEIEEKNETIKQLIPEPDKI